jgi:hypothetical protein
LTLTLTLRLASARLDVSHHLLRTRLFGSLHLGKTTGDLTLGLDALLLANECSGRSLASRAHGCRLLGLLAHARTLVFERSLRSRATALGDVANAPEGLFLCRTALVEPERVADVASGDGRSDGANKTSHAAAGSEQRASE